MNKQEMKKKYTEALAKYLKPIQFAANTTRVRLGLAPVDITGRDDITHKVDYFENGFKDGGAGYYDKWYEDKVAFKAYLAGNYAGRDIFCGEFQTIGGSSERSRDGQ